VGLGRAMPYHVDGPALHRNVWASMFTVQACELSGWSRLESLDWRHLV
jgi:hypothetical protein